jgi:hypothetical protein
MPTHDQSVFDSLHLYIMQTEMIVTLGIQHKQLLYSEATHITQKGPPLTILGSEELITTNYTICQ